MKILNEKTYAEKMIKHGFMQKKYEYELKILAKYYFFQKNVGEELKNKLLDFCKLYIKNFNEIKYMNMLKRSFQFAETNSLFIVQPVRITQLEIDEIKTLNDLKVEKVAFILLVLSKINRQSYELYLNDKVEYYKRENKSTDNIYISPDYIVKDKISSVFILAKIYLKKIDKSEIFKLLIDKGFIEMSESCKYKILYVKDDDTLLMLDNFKFFNDFVLEYEKLIGDNIGYCECSKPIRITSSRSKYCKECWKIRERELKRDWKRKKASRSLIIPS